MAFNPDEFLKKTEPVANKPFDPDEFLKTAPQMTAVTGSAAAGIERLKGDIALLKGKTGLEDVAKAEADKKRYDAIAAGLYTPTEKGWKEAPGTKFGELLGGSLPYMAAPAVAAVAAPEALGTAGIIGLSGLASELQFTGSNLSRQMETGKSLEEASLGKAAAAAAPQAALDIIGFKMIPGVRNIFGHVGKELSEDAALELAKRSLAQKAADYTLKTGMVMSGEGLTEAGQQVLERLQAGLSITDKEARQEYFDNFVGGAVLGGALAVPGHVYEAMGKAKGEEPPTITPQGVPGLPSPTAPVTPAAGTPNATIQPGDIDIPAEAPVTPSAQAPVTPATSTKTPETVTPIPFERVAFDATAPGNKRYERGESNIIDYADRKIVMQDVNGVQVPFYLSTGRAGKTDVPAGRWYPFFGIGSDGWINKTGGKEMAEYYGSDALRQAAENLDSTIGDIRDDQSIPKVGFSGAHVDHINQNLSPAENNQKDTLDKVKKNIADTLARIDQNTQQAPASTTPVASEVVTPVADQGLTPVSPQEPDVFKIPVTTNKEEQQAAVDTMKAMPPGGLIEMNGVQYRKNEAGGWDVAKMPEVKHEETAMPDGTTKVAPVETINTEKKLAANLKQKTQDNFDAKFFTTKQYNHINKILDKNVDNPQVAKDLFDTYVAQQNKIKTAQSERAKQNILKSKVVNPETDDILVAIAKLGGIKTENAIAHGFDPKDITVSQLGSGLSPTFHNGAKARNIESMREALAEHEYIPFDSSEADMVDLIGRAVAGEKVLTPKGQEYDFIQQQKYESEKAQAKAEEEAKAIDKANTDMAIAGAEERQAAAEAKVYETHKEKPELTLKGETEAEIKAAEKAKEEAKKKEAKKVSAPPAEEFTLTGSKREADIAAGRGAQDLFAAKPEKKLSEREQLHKDAKAIKNMDEETRDNTAYFDLPGGSHAANLYEAQKMLPNPSGKLKKVTADNSMSLWQEYDYIANIDGELYGITKQEDPDEPDDESKFVYHYNRVDEPVGHDHATYTDDVGELFDIIRKEATPLTKGESIAQLEEAKLKEPANHQEQIVEDFAKKAAADFMVGDSVRYGNLPGVVVGLSGDYVKFRPDNATNPKAYQRVQKSQLKFISRPASGISSSASKMEETKFGKEEGQLNADMPRLIKLLGGNMYGANLPDVAVKEMLQNSFDAVKAAIKVGLIKEGEITIDVNRDNRTIRFTDNARGMTTDIVKNAFFTVAGTDKSDLEPSERSGGLGLAKMGFLLGSESVKLDTVRDGVRTVVNTTSDKISRSDFDIVKTPAPKDAHGTTIEVKIPEFFVDSKTFEEKTIWFPWSADIEPLKKPLIGKAKVTVNYTRSGTTETTVLPIGVNFNEKEMPLLTKANFSWGSAEIYFGVDRKEHPRHQVLSSGVYQFDQGYKLSESEKIPYDIIVNIKPNVEASHQDYPFENSRERFKPRLEEDMVSLEAFLARVARGEEAKELQENFKGIVSMPRVEAGEDVSEVSKKLQKVFDQRRSGENKFELPAMPKSIDIKDKIVSDDRGQVLIDTEKLREKKKESTFEAEQEAPSGEEFMLKMEQDPKLPIFHNNTNVDFIEVGAPYGDPQKFFAELGTLMVEMKEELANSGMWKYDQLSPENLFFAGISIDKGYGGLHLKLPYKAILLNPFYDWGAKSLFGVRSILLTTMIHEIAHQGDMGHGVGHNSQMMKVERYLADSGMLDYFRDALMDVLVRHESTFTAMRDAYGKSTTKNTAKSLATDEQGAASTRGTGDGGEDERGSVSSGIRRTKREIIQDVIGSDSERQERGRTERPDPVNDYMRRHNRTHARVHHVSGSIKDTFMGGYGTAKKTVERMADNPMLEASKMASDADRILTNARNKSIWYGTGLEQADRIKQAARGLAGKFKDAYGNAIASVALTNAIHAGHIGTQVMIQGKLIFDPVTQMFKAAKSNKSMANVVKAKVKLEKKIGAQAAADVIQAYFEAKRSRSIVNEYLNREAIYQDAIDSGEKVEEARKALADIERAVKAVNMDDNAIDEGIAFDKLYPELRTMMDNWTAVNHNMLDMAAFSGIMSKKRAAHLKSIKDYVPWYRIMDDMEDVHSQPAKNVRGLTNVSKEKKFVGSDRDIDDIVDNMMHNIMMMTRNSMRNYAANRIVMEYGIRNENNKIKVFPKEGTDKDGVKFNILANGRRIVVGISDPLIAESVLGMEAIEIPMNNVLSSMSNFFRRSITTFPAFQVIQMTMDAPTAAWVSGVKNPFGVLSGTFGGFIRALGKNDPIVESLRSYGIGGYQSAARTPEKELAIELGLLEGSWWNKTMKTLDRVGDASDYAQRRAVYDQVLKETGDELQAVMAANNVIDFLKRGSSAQAQFVTRTVAFMNAYAQSIDVLATALAGGGMTGKTRLQAQFQMAKTGMMLASMTLLYCMLVGDDDDYKKLDDQTKIRNFVIPGTSLKLPMHTAASFFFKAVPELLYNKVINEGTKNEMDNTRLRTALKDAAMDLLFGPQPIPTGVRAPLEVALNHDFFTGSTVVPRGKEGLDAARQYNASTSELGKIMSKASGGILNPIQMDHLMRGLTGTVGMAAMWGSNLFSGERPTEEARKNPFYGSFIMAEVPRGNEALYYDFKGRSEEAYKTFTDLAKKGHKEEAQQWFNDHKVMIQGYGYTSGVETDLKSINGEIDRLSDLPSEKMSGDEKRARINKLKETKNRILQDVIAMRVRAGL